MRYRAFTSWLIYCFLLLSCEPAENQQAVKPTMKPEVVENIDQEKEKLTGNNAMARIIMYGGHGKLFDKDLNELELNDKLVNAIQDSMIDELFKYSNKELILKPLSIIEEAQAFLLEEDLSIAEVNLIKNGIIGILLEGSSKELNDIYRWRYNIVLGRSRNIYIPNIIDLVRPRVMDFLERIRIFDFIQELVLIKESNYIRDCRAHNVPIPPDWAETGTNWVKHGILTTNLLEKNGFAEVWSYSDPNVRGGCIALPRGNGGVNSPLGIICQSATTGHACFWDNIKKGETRAFGWKNKRVVISKLQDASNLNMNCTGCHQGNNVFIVAPDDNIWGEVLGRVASPSLGANFTMEVDSSTDNQGGKARYIPISTLPIRSGWQNRFLSNQQNCAQACHEESAWTVRNGTSNPPNLSDGSEQVPSPMPPRCANGGVANCY